MKIFLWILGVIGTGFFGGYLYFSNEDLANIIFYVSYSFILVFALILLWKIFSGIISLFGYDHYTETIKPITILFVIFGIFSFILIFGFLLSELFKSNLRIFSNNLSSRIEVKKGEKPIINLSSNSQTGTTNN